MHSSTFILSQAPVVVAYLTVHLPGIYGGIFVGASVVVAHRCHLFHSLGGSFFVDDMCTSSRIFTLFATVGIFCHVNQDVLTICPLYQAWRQCFPVAPFCSYLMQSPSVALSETSNCTLQVIILVIQQRLINRGFGFLQCVRRICPPPANFLWGR